ncbi:MAG: PCI domain-containing protein [Candidatus Lokiarchaeota archaeon]|nr:PCI domain-containing protein [Candidatus Lokiarchaeota archaeon]
MKCLFCESEKIDFTCERCKSSFCINHIATTEQWECKKHEITMSKAKAVEQAYKCTVVENSVCPECKGLLKLERLSSGQYYFECTDPKCAWNSYLKTPGLFFPTKEKLVREGQRYQLLKGFKMCGRRLKENEGKDVCPKCFLDLLKRSPVTNFDTIKSSFNIPAQDFTKLIEEYLEEERIYGIIDQVHQIFYYISDEVREKILSKFHDEGLIKVKDLGTMLDMSTQITLKIIYKLIRKYQIKGSFSQDKEIYYTQKYITSTFIKKINEKGRIRLDFLAREFNIPEAQVKSFCVNLMRTNEINAFFADKGNEIITASTISNEIKAYAKDSGVFELSKLAQKLKIAVELARKSLHNLIKKGSIKGIFTQRREFATEKYLQEKIKELAKAYRTMPLKELSNRLGVTETSIEELLAKLIGKGEIDGYIDMHKRLFVAYSVSAYRQEDLQNLPKQAEPIVKKDDVEVVREYDFIGGQLHFKVVVRNNGNMAIHSVKVILDVPTSYKLKEPLINIPVIEPANSRGVDFYLEPHECGISSIGGTVIYKTARGDSRTIHVQKKEVQIKCPLVCTSLSTIEDCQLSIQTLPNDARAFLIADLDPRLAFRAAIRSLKNFETSMVTSHETGEVSKSYEGEAWFCSEAKVTGGRIITRAYVSEANQSLEVRVWCANPGQLTGFLAKVIELLFEQINIIRKIRSDEREKTIDVMAITQNLAEVSDYCMLRWKAQNIRNKLHDTFVRLRKMIGDNEPVLSRMEYWLSSLNKYEKDENISEEEADKLVNDVEQFKNVLARSLKI